ncbi:ionotropic receptor 25a-like [Stegodyphus dumicola]|uniref:ionotropic receptor 25a-like n=1 Tax=Stegodyphus dumicola TaxID=202533 RepID=UPI0015ABB38F|nr:ionotropic receptor 25a-like [Stegodyphus dumicola]
MDGFAVILSKINTTDILIETLHFLKSKHMINSKQSWIFAVDGMLCLSNIAQFLDEGDRVIVVGEKVTHSDTICQTGAFERSLEILEIWSFHSVGNGSTYFQSRGFWNSSDNTVHVNEPIFDIPFKNFGGRTLKISALGSPPIKVEPPPGTPRWNGFIFRIINTLADIYNFTYKVKEAEGRLYGMQQKDGTWSGMIGELTRKSADMGAGDLSWTLDRSIAIDLTLPIFPETSTFIYKAPAFYSRTWILFQDIDAKIWISLMSVLLASSSVYCLTLGFHEIWNRQEHKKVKEKIFLHAAVGSISSLYRILIGQGISYIPCAASCRAILAVWIMGCFVLNSLYSGTLTSTLSLHKSPRPADSLQDLLKKYPNAKLALRNNSQIHSYFKESPLWRNMWLKNMESYVIPGKVKIADTMEKVHGQQEGSSVYVWVAERAMLVKMMHKYSDDPFICDLYVGREDIIRSDWSLALIKNSPFLSQFDAKILRMHRFGLLEKWRKDYWESAQGTCRPNDGLNPTALDPISFSDTKAIFFVLALGWLSGIVILLIERLCYNY